MQTISNGSVALNAEQSRRLASACARLNRHTFEIAEAFSQSFSAECPGVSAMAKHNKAARHEFAWNVAEVVKSLGDLRRVAPMLEFAGRTMNSSGWTSREWSSARRCLLQAIRTKCDNWNAEAESDFTAAIDACFGIMGANAGGSTHAAGMRKPNAYREAA